MLSNRMMTLLAGVAALSCNSDSTQPPGPPTELLITGGNQQSWYFNNVLPTALSVIATDPSGRGVPGVTILWTATSGGLNPAQSMTDASGVATTRDSLGSSTQQTVNATFTGLPVAVTFTQIGLTPPTTADVTVQNFLFNADSVLVQAGGTVTWTWASGQTAHNVTYISGPTPLPTNSTNLTDGATFSTPFTSAGTYTYRCSIHPTQMNGKVVVVH
jgi:plastocyanin